MKQCHIVGMPQFVYFIHKKYAVSLRTAQMVPRCTRLIGIVGVARGTVGVASYVGRQMTTHSSMFCLSSAWKWYVLFSVKNINLFDLPRKSVMRHSSPSNELHNVFSKYNAKLVIYCGVYNTTPNLRFSIESLTKINN